MKVKKASPQEIAKAKEVVLALQGMGWPVDMAIRAALEVL